MEKTVYLDITAISNNNDLLRTLSEFKKKKAAEEIKLASSERQVEKENKSSYLRIYSDEQLSFKKNNSTFVMKCTQLGIQESVGNLSGCPERDVLMEDFMTVESNTFSTNASELCSPRNPSFVFKSYAPIAFRHFRDLFGIKKEQFVSSFCEHPLTEVPNPGASGSLLYLTQNDEFLIKTVPHKEANFLQKLLPGYYLNLNQNPLTLLPKFFGLYCFQRDFKNVRLVVMNNVLPSCVKIHQKYDLKGSTCNRKASKQEILKNCPTFKDLDFIEHHPEGIFLEYNLYRKLMKTIERDCRVLESFQIIDYSLLLGVHYLNQTKKESLSTLEEENLLGGKENNLPPGDGVRNCLDVLTNLPNHEVKPHPKTNKSENLAIIPKSPKSAEELTGGNTALPYLPGRRQNGDKLLLFIGIIDVLQSYTLKKRLEHVLKSCIYDGDSVSVHNPTFYAHRFKGFLSNNVFKASPSSPRNNRRKSASRFNNANKKTSIDAGHV